MECYQKSSITAFWNKFSDDDGNRMSFTAISQALWDEREAEATMLADKACKAYSKERFEALFSYTKSGKKRLMTKDSSIAKTYKNYLVKVLKNS